MARPIRSAQPDERDQRIAELRYELDKAQRHIVYLGAIRVGFDWIELWNTVVAGPIGHTVEELYAWDRTLTEAAQNAATAASEGARFSAEGRRAPCPFCNQKPTSNSTGFTVPEGLDRHLSGSGARQCLVMSAAERLIEARRYKMEAQ